MEVENVLSDENKFINPLTVNTSMIFRFSVMMSLLMASFHSPINSITVKPKL